MVFDYMAKKYGTNNVAHIGTISRFRPKSALIQVCKALGIPPQATAGVKVAMIERSSADARAGNCLEDTLTGTTPGRDFVKAYPQAKVATLLEEHAQHTGVHAAGLLVCDDEITDYAVVDSRGIAHIEKGAAETLGLLKIDVLGLRTLGILEDSGVDIDWYNLKFDDPATFEIFNKCLLCGIFQFDGEALRSISSQIEFKTLTEVDAVTALARPGPFGGGVTLKYIRRKNGEPYEDIHPLVAEHMSETFGLPVYQEQTLAIVREIGKFDWKETSTIRKAMSKRLGEEFFNTHRAKFVKGAASQGINEEEALKTWTMINAMGAWQMNKAHTYSYAVISYWTAYLKAHHPLEFAAANLRNAKDVDNAIMLLREMNREGFEYVPFDLKKSEVNWCVKDGKLYGGFTALRGIGEVKAAKFIKARNEGTLDAKQLAFIEKASNSFADIFPFHTHYQHLYDDPDAHGIGSQVYEIADINTAGDVPHGQERVFLGELIYKNQRDANEEVNIKKRGGKVLQPPLEYVDMRIRDDGGVIGGRIGRFDFERCGRDLLENIPVGSHLMIRAKFYNNIPWAFIQKWRRIDEK
jgi:DNA polymerase III alpha subunit